MALALLLPSRLHAQTVPPCAVDASRNVWLSDQAVANNGVVPAYQACVTWLAANPPSVWPTAPAPGYTLRPGDQVPASGPMCVLDVSQRSVTPKHKPNVITRALRKLHILKTPSESVCQCGCAKLQTSCSNDMGVCNSQ
jgi:hypothetical protein